MKKEHPHAQVLRWIADGENVQTRRSDGSEPWWSILENAGPFWLEGLLQGHLHDYEIRIKPKTIPVGDREIEAPVMSGPGYFITDQNLIFCWFDKENLDPKVVNHQKLGRVFATEEAARAAQEAITALLTREPS